jgi:AraC-like DNA-binding protein
MTSTALPRSRLVLQPMALSSCVHSTIVRDTRGTVLAPAQRLNYFPASPLCGIFWLLEGDAVVVRRDGLEVSEASPRITFAGPHTVPMVSANPGPVHAFLLGLLPQAVQAMTGLDLATLVNRTLPLEAVLQGPWLEWAERVLHAADDAERMALVEGFLGPRWQACSEATLSRPERYRHWAEALARKAHTSGVGQSIRQAERCFKQWAGLPQRELRRLSRAEDLFFAARAPDSESGPRDWATLALDMGYSDQAHLCREVRRASGLSPQELDHAITHDESFWLYRLWI